MTLRRSVVSISVAAVFIAALISLLAPAERGQARPLDEVSGSNSVMMDHKVDVPAGVSDARSRLMQATDGTAEISVARATGVARFLRLVPGSLDLGIARKGDPTALAEAFFREYGGLFGLRDAAKELRLEDSRQDRLGYWRLSYKQVYQGLEVFGGQIRLHLDPQLRLTAVNGFFIPGIDLQIAPSFPLLKADPLAKEYLKENAGDYGWLPESLHILKVENRRLLIFRENLVKGVAGPNHLAYEIEFSSPMAGAKVYVDARGGQVLDAYDTMYSELDRVIYDAMDGAGGYVPGDPDANVLRREGDPPSDDDVVNLLYDETGFTYDLFMNAFGQDSYDGQGATMRSQKGFQGDFCSRGSNAQWTGSYTRYCPNLAVDDVVGHEWAHAYTEYSHGLIYAWQPGALNESYSDIFGEVQDLINGTGLDDPSEKRNDGLCTRFTTKPFVLTINEPADIAGEHRGAGAAFGPRFPDEGLTGDLVLAEDSGEGQGTLTDACEELSNAEAVKGKIALVDRGSCAFTTKVVNAQSAGAIGVLVANNVAGSPFNMGGTAPTTITIPSAMISRDVGNLLKDHLEDSVNVTLGESAEPVDDSFRWLIGEESGLGVLRDMWTPECAGHVGKVSAGGYWCTAGDSGGVHANSSVPNHAFALLVDGGVYNGHSIEPLGMTKATHLYYRAMMSYQVNVSHFPDHADALEQSCTDLVGQDLNDLLSGEVSEEKISQADCQQVRAAIAAVELRTPPAQCNFGKMFDNAEPTVCDAPTSLFEEDFETDAGDWTVGSRDLVNAGAFGDLNWELSESLPDSREGSAFFGANPNRSGGGNMSGVIYLDSPVIESPTAEETAGPIYLRFDHYVALEVGFDAGAVRVRSGDGPWKSIGSGDMLHNAYTGLLPPLVGNSMPQNPMIGEFAYSGANPGTLLGSWGHSIARIDQLITPGEPIQLRFEVGTDTATGWLGWYVDDVRIEMCSWCGDGVLNEGETCDDGNGSGGDGCSASCQVENRYECTAPVLALEAVRDGGFENLGDFEWEATSSSEERESALCPVGNCLGNAAYKGEGWAQFGLYGSRGGQLLVQDRSFLTQTVTIPESALTMTLQVMAPYCRSPEDSLRISIDDEEVLTVSSSQNQLFCNQFDYQLAEVDISDHADGGEHTLVINGTSTGGSIYYVDEVSIGVAGSPSICTMREAEGIFLPFGLAGHVLIQDEAIAEWRGWSADGR